jgi:hypothetical protein
MLTQFTVMEVQGRTSARLTLDLLWAKKASLTVMYDGGIVSEGEFDAPHLTTPSAADAWFQDKLPIVNDYGVNVGFESRIAHFDRLNTMHEAGASFIAVAA